MIVCSPVISSIRKDVCVPQENVRYKPQIIPPAPAGITIHVLAVSFALYNKEEMRDVSVINLHSSLYPLHTLLEALPAPNVPVLPALGEQIGERGRTIHSIFMCQNIWGESDLLSLAGVFLLQVQAQVIDRGSTT